MTTRPERKSQQIYFIFLYNACVRKKLCGICTESLFHIDAVVYHGKFLYVFQNGENKHSDRRLSVPPVREAEQVRNRAQHQLHTT